MKEGNISPLVAEFGLKTTRDRFYSAYLRERNLKLRDLGIPSDRRVFICECLAAGARKVKSAALQLNHAGKLASVFTKKGVVHVKRRVGESPIAVKLVQQLDNF